VALAGAVLPPKEDDLQMRITPVPLWYQRLEVGLCLLDGPSVGQAPALG